MAPLARFGPFSGGQLRLGPLMVVSYGQGDRGPPVGVRFHKTPRAFAASLGSRHLLGQPIPPLRVPEKSSGADSGPSLVSASAGSRASQLVPPEDTPPAEIHRGGKEPAAGLSIWGCPERLAEKGKRGQALPHAQRLFERTTHVLAGPPIPPRGPSLGHKSEHTAGRLCICCMAPLALVIRAEHQRACAYCPLSGSCILLQGLCFSSRR